MENGEAPSLPEIEKPDITFKVKAEPSARVIDSANIPNFKVKSEPLERELNSLSHSKDGSILSEDVSKHSEDVSKHSEDVSKHSEDVSKHLDAGSKYSNQEFRYSSQNSRYPNYDSNYSDQNSRYLDEDPKHSERGSKKKLIHPNRFLFKLADKVYKEIDHFFISQENHFGCQEMLQIVFSYKDLKNIDRHKIGFLSSQDPGFIIEDEIEEKICENYKK